MAERKPDNSVTLSDGTVVTIRQPNFLEFIQLSKTLNSEEDDPLILMIRVVTRLTTEYISNLSADDGMELLTACMYTINNMNKHFETIRTIFGNKKGHN